MDVILAERFGWTWVELDEQDMSQVMPAVSASNIHAALQRVEHWMELAGAGHKVPFPSDSDMQIQQSVKQTQKDVANS